MKDVKLVGTTLVSHFKHSVDFFPYGDKKEEIIKNPYASTIGSFMYAMLCNHLDIAHSVGVVIGFLANPTKQHWQDVK